MFRTLPAIWMVLFCVNSALAQLPIHTLNLSGDSLIYSNSPFKFIEVIDARRDTTKLGLLKETWNGETYQLLSFPNETKTYLLDFLSSVITYQTNTTDVLLVIKDLRALEEPLGAIEIAKTYTELAYYEVKDGRYRLIKELKVSIEQPGKEMTPKLSSQLELTLRENIHEFLSGPTTEGETMVLLKREELMSQVVREDRLTLGPTGKLSYSNNQYWLAGVPIERSQMIAILEQADDDEINRKLLKHRNRKWQSAVLLTTGAALVTYPIWDFAKTGGDFNGRLIGFGGMSGIGGLLLAKLSRRNMKLAVELFNERFNE